MRRYTIETADHPFVKSGELCRACLKPIVAGDEVTLVPLGPGDNEEERLRMLAGIPYTARCSIVHAVCAHKESKE